MTPSPDPHDPAAADVPAPGETEDLMDLNLDEAMSTDLQALADAVAEEVPEVAEDPGLLDPFEDLQRAFDHAQERIQSMEGAQAEIVEQHRRLSSDFANFRNRASRDTQMAVEQAERRLLLEILAVLDNFERGLAASYPSVDALRGGIELIHKQFLDTFRRLGVSAVDLKVGDPFDASHAEALTTISSPDLPDHSIATIFERGFMLRNLLLRPARVVVNHLPSAPSPTSDPQGEQSDPGLPVQ
jgi:molecular chaperone GrpE